MNNDQIKHDSKVFLLSIPIFIFLSLYYLLDVYNTCVKEKTYKIILLIFAHVFISVFSYTGIFYKNKIITILYLYFLITIVMHWITNDGKCILTQYKNNMCNLPESEKYDIVNRTLGIEFSHTLLFIMVLVTVYKLT